MTKDIKARDTGNFHPANLNAGVAVTKTTVLGHINSMGLRAQYARNNGQLVSLHGGGDVTRNVTTIATINLVSDAIAAAPGVNIPMRIKAPFGGEFFMTINDGDTVAVGDEIGTIVNRGESYAIRSTVNGQVISIRGEGSIRKLSVMAYIR